MAGKVQYITTKYGTKINVSGLSPEQIKKVKSISEDRGAYGAKGAALAQAFQKQNAKASTSATVTTNDAGTTGGNGATGAGTTGGDLPTQDDPLITKDDLPELPGGGDVAQEAAGARDAAYGYLSKDFATNKQQEIEAMKQELAERGIPINPDEGSLYARSLAGIDKKYQALEDQARNQAWTMGNETFKTEADVQTSAVDEFLKAAGLDQDTIIKMKQIAASKKIAQGQQKTDIAVANIRNQRGGGGGGSTDTFGGDAP